MYHCLYKLLPLQLMSSFMALMEVIKCEYKNTAFLFSALSNQYCNGKPSTANRLTNPDQGWAKCPEISSITSAMTGTIIEQGSWVLCCAGHKSVCKYRRL
ncbi:hypothetical protein GDO81_002269 [Engystomops pustulosus]|uniref:Secreted protein n=1 Tax=Engystomops pustulosus TaxID=76066 RepID=A0AAV7DJJ2_ENGPU|nr:hypothetical protein GDO81_002269 [Engystomops pustulosus]